MLRTFLLGVALLAASPVLAQHTHGTPSSNETAATKAYREAMERMAHGMAGQLTGDADKDFVMGMIAHHQGAIDMAKVELQYGKDPDLRKLAQEIVTAQEREIVFMRAWLAKQPK